jgi:tryptophanyl-tRNA synthetase
MKANYDNGGYGYGHAKQALYELIISKFSSERARYNHYMSHLDQVDAALEKGAEKAKLVANDVLQRVRHKLGY